MQKKFLSSFLWMLLRVFAIGVVIFLILNLVGRTSGIGYTATYETISGEVFGYGRGEPKIAGLCILHLEVSYNPLLFPLSHLSGNGRYSGETWVLSYPGEDMGEIAAMIRVSQEITRNLPYFLAISLAVGLVLEELMFGLSKLKHGGKGGWGHG